MIDGLRKIAPTTAVKGNVDRGEWAKEYPETEFVVLAGRAFYVVHNLKEITLDPAASGFDVVISGHSHRPKIETKNGTVCVNPGSAGPRRFKLPVAVATLAIAGSVILPRILEIAPYRKKSRVSHEDRDFQRQQGQSPASGAVALVGRSTARHRVPAGVEGRSRKRSARLGH